MSFMKHLFSVERSPSSGRRRLAIAFLDTGVSPVEDFVLPENRILAFRDLINGRQEPYDDNGHGTHVPAQNNEKIKTSNVQLLPVPSSHSFLQLQHSQ